MLPPSWKAETQKAVEEIISCHESKREANQDNAATKITASIDALRDAQNCQTSHQDSGDKKNRTLSLVTVALLFVTVFFTYKTWSAISDQVVEMRKVYDPIKQSADAAKAAATAAQKSADLAEEALTRRDRAFVYYRYLQTIPVVTADGSVPNVLFIYHLENGGNTRTRDMHIRYTWDHLPGEMPANYAFRYNGPAENVLLLAPPHQDIQTAPSPVGTNILADVWQKTEWFYFYGEVTYKDVFDDKVMHITRFCREIRQLSSDPRVYVPGRQVLFSATTCPRYNCADEECQEK